MIAPPRTTSSPRGRRRLFLFLVLAVSALLIALGWLTMAPGGWSLWEVLLMLCLAVNAPWIGLSAATAIVGGGIRLFARDPSSAVLPALRALDPAAPIRTRTVLCVCVRNEDIREVLWPAERLLRDLEAAAPGRFALGVLSDTNDPAHVAAEDRALAALAAGFPAGAVIHRRRLDNAGYKAGNVMEFLDHHANPALGGFEFALMLDADSEMTADAVLRLVRIAEADPRAGILQPTVAGRPMRAPFAQLFGFGHRHGSRVWATGQAWWQDDEGPFWGHNALVRIEPFRAHCRLDLLPDGSHILSHDHVEAARLHGAGWAVRVLPEDEGSREAHPPHLRAFLSRDLRWAAGNLQYRWLLRDPRLSPLGRFQMLQAIAHYALTPLWFAMLPLAALNVATGGAEGTPRGWLLLLLVVASVATQLPKLLGYAEALFRLRQWRDAGAMGREVLFTALFDPIAALDKTMTVFKLLLGRGGGWPAQERVERPLRWREGAARFWPHTLAGLVILALFAVGGWFPLLVSLFFAAGLVLSVPFCVLTSRPPRPGDPSRATDAVGERAAEARS